MVMADYTDEVIIVLGMRIAALRRRRGMSQAELAKHLQVSASAVGMYEQGRREPSLQLVVEMSRLFGVSADYILTGANSPAESEQLQQLLQRCVAAADRRLEDRRERPFSREELAVLFAAMLIEP